MVVVTGVAWFVGAVAVHHRVMGAADLAALAAAATAVSGERHACGEARWVVERSGFVLRSCRLSGWDALVEVDALPAGVLGQFGPTTARARAGQVERHP